MESEHEAETEPEVENGMSQLEVARALGITRVQVADIERRALRKLRRVINASFHDLRLFP